MKSEKGQILPFVLAALAIGTLIAIPFLTQAGTTLITTRTSSQEMTEQYSADAGTEHALWRLKHEAGFADSLTAQNPTVNYGIAVNALSANITVTLVEIEPPPQPPPPPQGSQGDKIFITASVAPDAAPVGQATSFTYTISIENTSTSNLKMEEIRDLLPSGFIYEAGSSSGVTTAAPEIEWENGRQKLVWEFSSPHPTIGSGATVTQTFRATATLQNDLYWNEAWVYMNPASVGIVGAGSSAPVGGEGISQYGYDIVSTAQGTTIRSRASLSDTGIHILFWQVE
ncbi:MAG: hypothetical protein Q8O76_01825 [Chloroflexota bacterium]|nr:hypothetical protein [Chloroflexota bacterium]